MRRLFTLILFGLFAATAFGQVYNLPYAQTFTGFPVDDVTFGPGAEPNPFPMDWTNVQTGDDAQDWFGRTVATGSSNTGPAADHTSGSGVYVFVEDGFGTFTNIALLSPMIDLVGVPSAEMRYWVHSYSTVANANTLVVDVWDGSAWVLGVDSLGNLGIDAWQERIVNMSPFVGDTVQVRFRGKNDVTSFEHDIAIDDFSMIATVVTANIGSAVMPLCNGGSDGSLMASATYGTAPYSYMWSTGDTSASISGLSAGNYCVTITDSMGDTSSTCFTLGEPTPITWNTVVATPLICEGTATGMIELDSVIGGTPYPVGCGFIPGVVCGGADDTLQIGNGATLNGTTSYPAPFGNWYWGAKQQYMFRASELLAAGVQPGLLKGIGWNVVSNTGTTTYNNYTVQIGCTTDSVIGNTFYNTLLPVYSAATYNLAIGWNYFPFSSDFYWNGTDNIVIETCHNNSSYTYNGESPYTTTGYNSCLYYRADAATVCGSPGTPTTSANRPNIRFMNCAAQGPQAYQVGWSSGDSTYMASNLPAGNYTFSIADQNGCSAMDSASIAESAGVSLPDGGFCPGGSATLDAGAGFVSYMWSTGDSTQTITSNTAGTYSVTTEDSIGCISSDSMTLVQNANPVVNLGGDQTVCEDATPLTLDAGAGASYLWSDGSTNQTLGVTASGTYSTEVTDSNGCMGGDTVTITVNPSPVVSLGNDTLICEDAVPFTIDGGAGFTGYSWSTGATTQTISVSSSGTYTVTVTDANGCEGLDDIVVTVDICTGITDPSMTLNTQVYPNPSNNFINVALQNAVPGDVNIKVLDLSGRQLHMQQAEMQGNTMVMRLDLQQLPKGVYFLHVTNGGKSSVHRITMQ